MTVDPLTANVWMVGGGVASMAAAAFLIRDAGLPGVNIHILETLDVPGGSLDGAESPVQPGYVTRGGRMLDDEAYRCLWNLLEGIPDRDDPSKSARQVIVDFNRRVKTQAHARLINSDHEVLDAAAYGFSHAGGHLHALGLRTAHRCRRGLRREEDVAGYRRGDPHGAHRPARLRRHRGRGARDHRRDDGHDAVRIAFGVDMEVPPIYHGLLDPKVGLQALESAFR
jgi:hypothetical protein